MNWYDRMKSSGHINYLSLLQILDTISEDKSLDTSLKMMVFLETAYIEHKRRQNENEISLHSTVEDLSSRADS